MSLPESQLYRHNNVYNVSTAEDQSIMRRIVIPILSLGLLLLLSACQGQAFALAPESELPGFMADAPAKFKQAYQFAIANPHDLETIPCYCGCGAMGHQNNLDCYIQEVALDGTITFDNHARGCGICVDITQDVMMLKGQGKLPSAIRAFIDDKYSKFGPSTDTPLPSG
jgi:hypothetical protein